MMDTLVVFGDFYFTSTYSPYRDKEPESTFPNRNNNKDDEEEVVEESNDYFWNDQEDPTYQINNNNNVSSQTNIT